MDEEPALRRADEDYIKAIYHIKGQKGEVNMKDLAHELAVSPASVTHMLKKLSKRGIVEYTPYHVIRLTPLGEKKALEVIRHHRLLELFLSEVLGYRLHRVHDEAESLEHVITEEFEEKISELLGNPLVDPHGSPIPDLDGDMVELSHFPLCDVAHGRSVVIAQLLCRKSEKLRYLERLGLLPGTEVTVLEKKPFDGPLSLMIGAARKEIIGHEMACQILVAEDQGRRNNE
jgi:DtxR family Mn-dependent transcriptional regulator